MKCTKCGNEMREGQEQVGLYNGVAIYNNFAYCDNCRIKFNLDALKKTKESKKNSALSVWACVLSLFGCTSFVAFILAIVDLCGNDKTKKHIGSWFALVVFILYLIIFVPKIGKINNNDAFSNPEIQANEGASFENVEPTSQVFLQLGETGNISEGEILFKDIPWRSSFPEVNEKLEEWNLWNISGEGYKTCSVDDILLGDYKGIDFDYSGINIISHAFNGEQEVAGYTTTDIILYFSYLPIGEYLTYEECDTALYGAQYVFKPVNLQDMYDDLIHKISEIYGEPNKQTKETDLWENQYTYTYWYGANNTELVLRSLNSENDTTELYNDEIYLTYVWRVGDELLKNASDAVKKEKSDKEKDAQGEGNLSGL